MKFKIQNKIIDRALIGIPAINYGQMQRYAKYERLNYGIVISPEGFVEKTADWFKEFRAEAIEDSGISRKGDYPVYDRYEEVGFPGLRELIDNYLKLLIEIILFHDLEILNVLCDHKVGEEGMHYSINSLDKLLFGKLIHLEGVVFKIM